MLNHSYFTDHSIESEDIKDIIDIYVVSKQLTCRYKLSQDSYDLYKDKIIWQMKTQLMNVLYKEVLIKLRNIILTHDDEQETMNKLETLYTELNNVIEGAESDYFNE